MRKGISPLVAAVLLIGVTMTIAGILAYWAGSFVRSQVAAFENQTVTSECNFADFRIYACSYDSDSQKMTFILNNLRTVDLKNLTVFVINQDNTVTTIPLNDSLPGNSLKSFSISVSPNYKTITIKTHCPGVSVSSGCR